MSSTFNINSDQRCVNGIGVINQPQLIYIPNSLYKTMTLTNESFKTLLNLEHMLNLVGPNGVATFLYASSLYNSQSDLFLNQETITGFTFADLLDKYRDDLIANEHLRSQYTEVVRILDGLKMTKPDFPENYLKSIVAEDLLIGSNTDEDSVSVIQYYVPVMFVISEQIYGVRLKAVTGLTSDDKKALKQATVANVGLLSNSYDIQQLAHFPIFKNFVQVC
jgi:hypothetical protein